MMTRIVLDEIEDGTLEDLLAIRRRNNHRYNRRLNDFRLSAHASLRHPHREDWPMTWRYQPVLVGGADDAVVELCEVYLDSLDRLQRWSRPGLNPSGADQAMLRNDLKLMLDDAHAWKAVPYGELRVGMTFEAAEEDESDEDGEDTVAAASP